MKQLEGPATFDAPDILVWLEAADDRALDGAPFGIVAMDPSGAVVAYNAYESQVSGLSAARVVGRNFFSEVGPCTNNFMVAQRFEDEGMLDEVLPYVFTLKMKPRRVNLRLLKSPDARRQYLLVATIP
jgi:photoactive yellow protein